MSFHRLRPALTAAALCVAPAAASAEEWVAAEVPAAVPMSAPHLDLFRAGAMPALGGYIALSPNVSLGLRMRFGFLAEGAAPGEGVRDPGRGGLIAGSLGLRMRAGGTWLEAAGGGGMTGSDGVPTFEVGVGHGFDLGVVALGPTVRYLHVVGGDAAMDPGSAAIVLVGLEVSVSNRKRTRAPAREPERVPVPVPVVAVAAPPPAPPTPPAPPPPPPDRDRDEIADADDVCPDQIEIVNGVDDADGCPDSGLFIVENDRIVLDERILFDTERARIHSRGRRVIAAIALAWHLHSDWVRFSIEGHADTRGDDEYNDELSALRADRVRAALIAAGVPADAIVTAGFGEQRPRDAGHSARAHQKNRRVEFGITRGSR
jgi:outer membrane protein OmpA-like peptidoglycan-associated protein